MTSVSSALPAHLLELGKSLVLCRNIGPFYGYMRATDHFCRSRFAVLSSWLEGGAAALVRFRRQRPPTRKGVRRLSRSFWVR
jgi:hypothetical protein